jgi:hypothetical protein
MDVSLSAGLAGALAAEIDGEVRFDAGIAAVGVCRDHDVPVLSRSAPLSASAPAAVPLLHGLAPAVGLYRLDRAEHAERGSPHPTHRPRYQACRRHRPTAGASFLRAAALHRLVPGTGRTAIAQPHCHQHAIWGFDADQELLRRAGGEGDVLDAGCFGLAGNFGFEHGHYDVSVGCAELGLWPAVRAAEPRRRTTAPSYRRQSRCRLTPKSTRNHRNITSNAAINRRSRSVVM